MTEQNIRIVASDLDGTLLRSGGILSPYSADVLRSLRRNGILIVICSGRPFYSVRSVLPDDTYDYACCLNGQNTCRPDGTICFQKPFLSHEEKEFLCSLAGNYPAVMCCNYETRYAYYVHPARTFLKIPVSAARSVLHLIHGTRGSVPIGSDFSEVMENDTGKISFHSLPGILRKMQRRVSEAGMSACRVNPYSLEVQNIHAGKGNALKEIMDLHHVPAENVLAAGDGENDLGMQKVSSVFLAPSNAMKCVRESADEHCGSCNTDSVARWLADNVHRTETF